MTDMAKIVLLAGMLLWLPAAVFPAGTLTIVTDQWPPYVYVENKEIKGADYEVMMAVLARMDYGVVFKIYPWKRCLAMIEKRSADGILDIGITEERKYRMIFPDEHISTSASVLFCLSEADFVFNTLEDLEGLRIGTLLGYVYSREISDAGHFEKIPVQTISQNIHMLLLGRIDMFIANRNAGLFTARKMGVLDELRYLDKEISGGPLYLAFSRKPGHTGIADAFSKHLKRFKQRDAYRDILIRYGLFF